MNTALWVARRYFFSGKEKKFINILSIIAMLGVAVGTAALVIVLSAFNGLEALVRKLDQRFDPEIKVVAAQGKTFEVSPAFLKPLQQIQGVRVITEVIEDNALLRYRDAQVVVRIKGVSDNFQQQHRIDSAMVAGEPLLKRGNISYAIVGAGIQQALGVALHNQLDVMQFWYPKNKKNIAINPADAFNKKSILASGVFQISSQYDEKYVFVPLEFAEMLMQHGQKRTALEIKTTENADIQEVKEAIKQQLGNKFKVLDSDEQHASFLRVMKIERLFTFAALLFILVIASFNIFVSLSMLAIEKRRDVGIFYALGADETFIQRVFIAEGGLIAGIGTAVGLSGGLALCLLQQHFGLVSMGMTSAVVEAYPVQVHWVDFVVTGLCVILFTIAATYSPAKRAAHAKIIL